MNMNELAKMMNVRSYLDCSTGINGRGKSLRKVLWVGVMPEAPAGTIAKMIAWLKGFGLVEEDRFDELDGATSICFKCGDDCRALDARDTVKSATI